MEHDLVLEGRVVTPGGVIDSEVGVTDGLIREVGRGLNGSKKVSARGCLIFPGFVDIHVHLREPGWERKEDFRTGSAAAVHGGVTTVADMPNNPSPTDNPEALARKAELSRKALIDVKFHGGISRSRPEALAKIADGVVGYKLYMSETTGAAAFAGGDMERVLKLVASTGKPLSVHCEDQAVLDRVKGAETHSEARPPEAEVAAVRKVLGSRGGEIPVINICHASTSETLRLVSEARGNGMKVRCEATLHHLFFSGRSVSGNRLLTTNPPIRGDSDREAMLSGLKEGKVDFLVTDHAPHLEEEKSELGVAGVPGLDDFSHVVSWLVRGQGVDPVRIASAASSSPAAHLGLVDRGVIRPGMRADITVVDMHSPQVVKNEDVKSRCGWSPYEGREFPGRARWVMSRGELLMEDFEQVA
ncbi:MAG: dihydroorotase family protein [Nitrososphaerota archaeon]|nr:dihydroorotase family protein [Nitrososphaerota archaeon]